jgi:hypothetical protein
VDDIKLNRGLILNDRIRVSYVFAGVRDEQASLRQRLRQITPRVN